jgi:hypothetical protein
MSKKEHILTLRVPGEIVEHLRTRAKRNYCSVSDIVRDILSSEAKDKPGEHVFQNKESWKKAVKERDEQRCQQCGAVRDLDVFPLPEAQTKDGSPLAYVLSNGTTLCAVCATHSYPLNHMTNGSKQTIYHRIPFSWRQKYRQSNVQGRTFWEHQLACFLTQRKRTISPIVRWYAETFLSDVPEDVLIRTLITLCPSPDIIASFPGRQYASPKESFNPPPLVWEDTQ